MNQPSQRECDYAPSNRAEFGIKSGVVGRTAKGFLMEQTGNTGSKSYLTPGARVTDPGKGEAFLRRQSELLEQGGSSRPELSREGNGLSGSCRSLTDMWEVQLNRPAVVNHTGSAFQASGQNMAERRRSLWAQFSQEKKEPSFRSWDGDGEDGVIQAGTVGNARGLLESSHAEVAKPFVPPPAGEAHGTARSKFQAALQGHSGGGIPKRGPVQRSKSCTSMQPLWDNLLNDDATPREAPKFIGGGTAVGMGQVRKSHFHPRVRISRQKLREIVPGFGSPFEARGGRGAWQGRGAWAPRRRTGNGEGEQETSAVRRRPRGREERRVRRPAEDPVGVGGAEDEQKADDAGGG